MKRIPPLVSIREVRRARGLSARQLAERIETEEGVTVDPDSLLNIELGHKAGSENLLNAWARALRIDPLDVHRPDDLRQRIISANRDTEAGAA